MPDPDEFERDRPRLTYAHSLPLPASRVEPLRRPHSLPAGRRPQLRRAKSWSQAVKKYIKHSTASFFGVDNENEENDLYRWNERHRRLVNRCCGQLKEEDESGVSTVDAALPSISNGRAMPMHRQVSEASGSQPLRPRIRRKDSVVKMTWDGVTFLTNSLARRRSRSQRRPPLRSRSYAPASIVEDSSFVAPTPSVPATPFYPDESIVDEVFFDKILINAHSPITTVPPPTVHPPAPPPLLPPSTPVPPSPSPSPPPPPPPFPSPPPSYFPFYAPSTSHVPSRGAGWRPVGSGVVPSSPTSPVGMRRIWKNLIAKALDNSDRRQYGIGLVGRLFGRSFRRDRITSDVRIQLDDIDDHRPFFTYWVTTIQILIAVISLAVYGFGPLGFEQTKRSSLVMMTSLSLQQVDYFEPDNFWIGPRAADLIHLGAKFVPCMRKDKHIFSEIRKDRERERETACCIRNDNSGCVQSSNVDCSTMISTWRKWTNESQGPGKRISGSVCGQDPSHCSDPPSVAPYDWPDDITKWPVCKKKVSSEVSCSLDHMSCELIGRPCCIGIFGDCRITTREYCDFINGFFHDEAFLCSQVSCLDDVCGMIPFYDPEYPDQVYRLWTSLFLHAGLIHLAITVVTQYFLMRDLEKLAGCVRIGAIYILSGVAGNLASAIFVPYRAEVGPAGSQFGLLACLFVEVFHSWPLLRSPGRALLKLTLIVLFLFLLGLLPWIDNYAHMIGFAFGFLLSYAILPFVSFGPYDRQRKIILIGVCLLLVIVLFTALVILFYVFPIYHCDTCKYFNCIPLTRKMCDHQNINITRGEL